MSVAPLVGAWIEIDLDNKARGEDRVAPLVGAWIEITRSVLNFLPSSRSPCGSVD